MPVVAKTAEEAEWLKKRGEKTKEVLFNDLIKTVNQALESSPGDEYLSGMRAYLSQKTYQVTEFFLLACGIEGLG